MRHSLKTLFFVAPLMVSVPAYGQLGIIDTKHNLSVSGPGEIRALTEDRICIFCHTPHNANTGQLSYSPLWNRDVGSTTYTLYQSSTMVAATTQPTGPSRLCLSCHDGTIALGNVIEPAEGIAMNMELTGRASELGTDISDDHPVSFSYYDALPDPELAPSVPQGLQTYGNGGIHCSTCHDAHDNTHGDFLVMDNRYSALCTTCHLKNGWTTCTHSTSAKAWTPPNEMLQETVAESACLGCHVPHSAGGPKRLLRRLEEEEVCYPCHDGTTADYDVKGQFGKISKHPVSFTTIGVTANHHDPAEDISFLQGHVECVDCHQPHAANDDQAQAPAASGKLNLVDGIDLTGSVVSPINYEYELCFKCHADSGGTPPTVVRWNNENNVRLEFDPANPSYHPVADVGKNAEMPSLPSTDEPTLTASSIIYCTDCHDSDASRSIGGIGPRGPHGSNYAPILRQRYDTADFTVESPTVYALCYRCHDRDALLNDQGIYGSSGHGQHIVQVQAPCSACHDPHGVQYDAYGDHTHLINFDRNIVSPAAGQTRPIFNDLGIQSGSCLLNCHGVEHDGSALYTYP